MIQNPYDLLIKAINHDELNSYLVGSNDYSFTNPWVEHPTNLGVVFSSFNQYNEKYGPGSLDYKIQEALIRLFKTPQGTWWVVNIVYEYILGFIREKLLFNIDIKTLIPEINAAIVKHREHLIANKDFVGYKYDNGLWDSVSSMIIKINKELEKEDIQIAIY
jgi:hypothetical protein